MTDAACIEHGYFVFTLMPSLKCELNCPHCYLSKAQRADPTLMSKEDLGRVCDNVDSYFSRRKIENKTIICYWYGGEPTSQGQEYFVGAADKINSVFAENKGYEVKHTLLTSLLLVDPSWYPIFDKYGKGEVQSSYDGLMRGKGYMRRWEDSVRNVSDFGLRLSTITVVNSEILKQGPEDTLDYLSELGVKETSWLPFMWNEQNDSTGKYFEYAATMKAYSDFMIRLSERWIHRKRAGLHVPEIGQLRFIIQQSRSATFSNIAGQTLFLMPDGDFVLPDYKDGWKEYMRPFGNGIREDFEAVLKSRERRSYIRKQVMRDGNQECLDCPHADKCLMEFWKKNRPEDDCFGARRYVEWVLENAGLVESLGGVTSARLY